MIQTSSKKLPALSLMVARTDVRWLNRMVTHLERVHRCGVSSVSAFIDTAPLGPAYQNRPGVGTLDDLRAIVKQLYQAGVIDEYCDIPYTRSIRRRLYKKYLGRDVGATHNFRGYPILGSLYSIDNVDADAVLHLDADMLVYQQHGSNWIQEGLALMEQNEDVMFVSPRSGPPAPDGSLVQRGVPYDHKGQYYAFKDFTSRKYLFLKDRLQQLLPIKPQYISWKRRMWQAVSGQSGLWNWEVMVSHALKKSRFVRADLTSNAAWTLHTPDHGSEFVTHLPRIINSVEEGWFPEEQAGDYDLRLEAWITEARSTTTDDRSLTAGM